MTFQELLLLKQTPLIVVLISTIFSAIIQYFFQLRLKNQESRTTESLKRLEAELKRQGDKGQAQFQTQFSASHKAQEEIITTFLDHCHQFERLLTQYYEIGKTKDVDHVAEMKAHREAMDRQRAKADIYLQENIANDLGIMVGILTYI